MKKVAQRVRITKLFVFDTAHALFGHNGPCRNIHGHTYKLSVTVIGKIKHEALQPDDGMVLDFGFLKKLVQNEIIETYDHALILNANSPHISLKNLENDFEKIIWFGNQPTCENLVVDMVERLIHKMPEGINLQHLKIEETPTAWAEWFYEDNL